MILQIYKYLICKKRVGPRVMLMVFSQIEKICKVANKPLVVTYTGLIQACIDCGNVKDGAYIFSHMKDFCSPNLVTCNIMLKGFLKHGMFDEGKELFQKMLEDGSHIKNRLDQKVLVAPDIYTFNTLLDACIAEKRWDDFEYAYEKMLHHGFHFNSKRHLPMILSASRAGKVSAYVFCVSFFGCHVIEYNVQNDHLMFLLGACEIQKFGGSAYLILRFFSFIISFSLRQRYKKNSQRQ